MTTETFWKEFDRNRAKERDGLKGIIDSDRYELLEKVGRGSWGSVYKARDNELTVEIKNQFSGKPQMKERIVAVKVYDPNEQAQREIKNFGINPLLLIKHEALDLTACSYVVPRRYEEDKNGLPFLVMPFCPRTLESSRKDIYTWNGKEITFNDNYTLNITKDLVNAIAEVHGKLGIVHGDWKDENVLRGEDGTWRVTDFSTSPIARSVNPGEDRGHRYTRAPECFSTPSKKGMDVNPRADVFGNAALIYSLYMQNFPLKEELSKINVSEYGKLIESKSVKEWNKIIRGKIKGNKDMPKMIKELLTQGLSFDPMERFSDGNSMLKFLENGIETHSARGSIIRGLKHGGLIGLAGLGIGLGAVAFRTAEPKYNIPQVSMDGYMNPTVIGTNWLHVTRENLVDLPKPNDMIRYSTIEDRMFRNDDLELRALTKNNAYVKLFFEGYLDCPDLRREVTPDQMDVWRGYTSSNEKQVTYPDINTRVIAKAVEVAISQSRTPKGSIKIEDVCSIGYIGRDRVDAARKAADSFRFVDYVKARDQEGKYIINEKEQKAIKSWISQINYNTKNSAIMQEEPRQARD